MEQLVLVPTSVHNNRQLKTQAVTKQERLEYQAEQNPRTKLIVLRRE